MDFRVGIIGVVMANAVKHRRYHGLRPPDPPDPPGQVLYLSWSGTGVPVDLAAYTMVESLILNLNETVAKR